ncbi:MAG: Txe/YoeB family addiction module toxin [Deltaproteobacteria bacterium]
MTWEIVYSKQAQKDAKRLAAAGLKDKAAALLDIIRDNPFHTPPRFEKLVGDLAGAYSRRITIQHRLIYEVLEQKKTIKVIRMWTHYE